VCTFSFFSVIFSLLYNNNLIHLFIYLHWNRHRCRIWRRAPSGVISAQRAVDLLRTTCWADWQQQNFAVKSTEEHWCHQQWV